MLRRSWPGPAGNAGVRRRNVRPVAAIVVAEDRQDAIRLANQSCYGLGATIFTENIPEAEKLAAEIDAGMVFINGTVKSDRGCRSAA